MHYNKGVVLRHGLVDAVTSSIAEKQVLFKTGVSH